MLNLRHAEPIAERLRPDAGLDTAADYDMDPETPMACESLVADAIGHLLSGFLIVKNLDARSRSVCGSVTTLELTLTSENICTVLKELNDCSVGFSQLPKTQIPVVARLREFRGPYKRRCGAPDRKCRRDAPADHAVEMKPRDQFAREFVAQRPLRGPSSSIRSDPWSTHQAGRTSITKSEWEESLASAILHLLGAYRAIEILSASAFPSGALDSFELACHCLCAALVTLNGCLAGCVD
jgi:hypothetical protein